MITVQVCGLLSLMFTRTDFPIFFRSLGYHFDNVQHHRQTDTRSKTDSWTQTTTEGSSYIEGEESKRRLCSANVHSSWLNRTTYTNTFHSHVRFSNVAINKTRKTKQDNIGNVVATKANLFNIWQGKYVFHKTGF